MNVVMYILPIGSKKMIFVMILMPLVSMLSIVALIVGHGSIGSMTGMDYQNIVLNVGRR